MKPKTQKIIKLLIILTLLIITPTKTNAVGDYTIENGKITGYSGSASEIVLPTDTSVTAIAQSAFLANTTITKVTIPGNIKDVESMAFLLCSNLKEVIVEEGVKGIGDGAFSYTSLTNVTLPGSIEVLGGIEDKESNPFKSITTSITIQGPQYQNNATETEISKRLKELIPNNPNITYKATNYGINVAQTGKGTIKINGIEVTPNKSTPSKIATKGETIKIEVEAQTGYYIEKITYKEDDGIEEEIANGTEKIMPEKNITINITLEQITHEITSTAGANGTITPNGITKVVEGNNKTYTITPDAGYTIDTLKIDGAEISPVQKYTFSNIIANHTIEVTFKQIEYYELKTNISNIMETTIEKVENSEVTIKTGTATNFISWVISGISSQNTRNFTFNMPKNAVEITYTFNEPEYNQTEIQGSPSLSGTKTTTTIDQTELTNAVQSANLDTIGITIPKVGNETEVEVTISKTNLTEINEKANISQLKIETGIGELLVQKDAINGIENQASGSNVTLVIKELSESNLTEAQKTIVGTQPVYKFKIISNGTKITDFDGNIIVKLPYTPKSGENTNTIKAYYIAEDGTLEEKNTIYKDNQISFTTTHFSEYYIKQGTIKTNNNNEDNNTEKPTKPKRKNKRPEKTIEKEETQNIEQDNKEENQQNIEEEIKLNYKDIKEEGWYIEAIKYAVKNKIASGITKDTFGPNENITRGQAVTMICKAYEIEEEIEGENFSDAGNTYYTGYIQTLKNKKIVEGRGENKFEPERPISRQELAVIIHKIIKYKEEQTINSEETICQKENIKNEEEYTDYNEISNWAKEAMEYFIEKGILKGYKGKINPKGNTTRAEMVQIIYNLKKSK